MSDTPYFGQLIDALDTDEAQDVPMTVRYAELYRILNDMMNERTERTGLVFSGPFARLTYLVREYGVEHELYRHINSFRALCKNLQMADVKQLETHYKYDAKALANFISAVTGEDIPSNLAEKLPRTVKAWKTTRQATQYIRVCVEDWNDTHIIATAENTDEEQIRINYTKPNMLGDWSYIRGLLSKGAQLNIIRPVKINDEYLPELIIFEPDYLIDISAIASCFKEYGVTPFTYLLNRFKKAANTKAILVGNIAGQMLDEEINNPKGTSYKDSAITFFRNNSLSIVTCQDSMATFHDDARVQQDNIRNIIERAQKIDHCFQLDKLVVEPSFFCEMLGIQGRMDLLHTEYKVLLEQKSGKRAFMSNAHQEPHYVQMLLYLALLHYNFGIYNEEVSCYLLYSKYPDGLMKEGPSPELLFKAMKLRNEVVWNEYYLGKGGIRMMERLTPDRINVSGLNSDFYRKYILPDITHTLGVIQSASKLEREYFFRMFTFMHREHILGKVGNSRKEANGLVSVWNCTLEEKKLAGAILDGLTVDRLSLQPSSPTIVWHTPESDDDYLPNFREADSVILYKYTRGTVPDARKGIVYRGSIECMTGNDIVVTLRSVQRNISPFITDEDTLWAMEHDFMETSSNSVNRGLFAFLEAEQDRRDLLLAQRKPRRDETVTLKGDYGAFNDLVLHAKQAQDYYIVIGPPGTGKTSFGMLNILKETLLEEGTSILLMSFTNRAVDEICSKLVKESIDFVRIGRENLCAEPYRPYMLENKIAGCNNAESIKRVLTTTRVIVGTTASLSGKIDIFTLRRFSLAIIDEASQILEPQILPLLSARHGDTNGIGKFVLIGDHKQLPAVVQQSAEESKVDEPILNDIHLYNCRNSLFERLLSLQDGDASPFVYRLTRQGRMHHDVALFSSISFYENKLMTVPLAHQEADICFAEHEQEGMENLLATRRVAFIPVERPEHSPSCKVNIPEAQVIASIVYAAWQLYNKNGREFITDESVGVIVPYRNQISVVRKEIDKYGIPELHDITIDTVERYQGSERDIIIYGFTIQREYQMSFLTNNVFEENGHIIDRKLNVALTRAKEHNIIVGNPALLRKNEIFKSLMEWTEGN
ncbi:MAG: ATP-binding protein [Bacteroidaceae bacterium]|nr:ATP-binding protein [Bacteroidaceae bacterium]